MFGVYELSRSPIRKVIMGFLADGVDGCVGSNDFNFCLETYMSENPPGADTEAQVRSFITALVGLADRIGVFGDFDLDDFESWISIALAAHTGDGAGNVRALAVTGYSLFVRWLPFVDNFSFF